MSVNKKIDSGIVARLNAGDDRALAVIYDCFAERLLRHALIRTSDQEIAKDLTHNVF